MLNTNIIGVYGTTLPPLAVSSTLKILRIGHTLVNGATNNPSYENQHFGKHQPGWPVIVSNVGLLSRFQCSTDRQVLFVCDSLPILMSCNLRVIKTPMEMNYQDYTHNMALALNHAVSHPLDGWELTRKEPSIIEYVNLATKPSFLNNMQTEIYKITPYALRLEVKALIIGYLAGVESRAKLIAKLKTSLKLNNLLALIMDSKTPLLKEAVALFNRTQDIEATAKATGFETFEILYVVNSNRKTVADKAGPKVKAKKVNS